MKSWNNSSPPPLNGAPIPMTTSFTPPPATLPNGKKTAERLRSAPYDLILMDVQMPEMDGLEAARRLPAAADGRPRFYSVAVGRRRSFFIARSAPAQSFPAEFPGFPAANCF
jgi:hypothetical protein